MIAKVAVEVEGVFEGDEPYKVGVEVEVSDGFDQNLAAVMAVQEAIVPLSRVCGVSYAELVSVMMTRFQQQLRDMDEPDAPQ